ncbi:MAG: hypothetical protein A2202_00290 [Bdellovibrionales bacterium RIFOXYA1_FULL_36_14]|nr:MAG: hypothetical protein A2202_00290 [Bdellovibrionales bacterium RIFOXYA1_FULL_36_14]
MDAGFKNATPIQELTMEPILSGKDVFAQAETGSGKTCAFVIPILEQILRDEKSGEIKAHESRYAILSPTRELAQQTNKVFQQFGKKLGIESCCIIGGESIERQKDLIGKGVHILVATPGRLADLVKQQVVALDNCKGVVFDEADRLFDMGFKKDIEFILSKASRNRQLIMLSATSNQDVLRTAYKFNSQPEELRLNVDSLLVDQIEHKLAMVSSEEKFPLLVNLLRKKENDYAIVFFNTQNQTHFVAEWLILMGFKAKPISGRLPQDKRTSLMSEFRSKKTTILCCTDVAARGLDIKNVNIVINYDLPQEAAHYVHRVGRTGRAGEAGFAISFCAHEDCEYLDPICKLINAKIEKMHLEDTDFATDICRKPHIDRKTLKLIPPKSYVNNQEPRPPRENYKKELVKIEKREDTPVQNVESNRPRIDRRFFEAEAYRIKDVKQKAMQFLRISDEDLLGHEVLQQGRKKYFFFGPKMTKFKFFVKPLYSKLLLPFLISIIKMAKLDLYVKVSFRNGSLQVTFNGQDEKLLTKNYFELLNSFEHLIITYLQSRIVIHRNLNIQVRCFRSEDKKTDDQTLINMAENIKKQVLNTNQPVMLTPMNSSERRIIHQHFANDKEVKTVSIGDSNLKQIQVSLK